MHHRMGTIPALALLIVSCQAERPASVDVAEPGASPSAQTAPVANPAVNTEGNIMQIQCGGTELHLIVESRADASAVAAPQRTALRMTTLERKAIEIAAPDELSDYTAVGLGCATSPKDGQAYFVVQYGELPYGCSYCEWYTLYNAQGRQLTRSEPPLLEDQTLPEGQTQYPNNREFEALMATLGIRRPEMAFVE